MSQFITLTMPKKNKCHKLNNRKTQENTVTNIYPMTSQEIEKIVFFYVKENATATVGRR